MALSYLLASYLAGPILKGMDGAQLAGEPGHLGRADETAGVTRTVVSAGRYKAEGWGPLSPDARQALQEATMRFAADLGRDDLRVQVVPLQHGERWGRCPCRGRPRAARWQR